MKQVKKHTMSNGVRVLTEEMPGIRSATIGVWINAGARDEHSEQHGVAHFLEHMAFKGTARRSAYEIVESIESVGGQINAYTSHEVTSYQAHVMGCDVVLALDVIGDIVLNSTFDEEDINSERDVILQEIAQVSDTPEEVLLEWLQGSVYPGHPLGQTILGTPESVCSIRRQDLVGFVQDHYTADRIVVVGCGAVDHESIVKQANGLFGALPSSGVRRSAPFFVSGDRAEFNNSLDQAHLALAYPGVGLSDPLRHTAELYATILGGGMSSALFQSVREEHGLAYTVYSEIQPFRDAGMILVVSGTSPDRVEGLRDVIGDTVAQLPNDLSSEMLDKAKAQLKTGLIMGLETPPGRAEWLVQCLESGLPNLEEELKAIDGVTIERLVAFAKQVANSAPASVIYMPGPCSC